MNKIIVSAIAAATFGLGFIGSDWADVDYLSGSDKVSVTLTAGEELPSRCLVNRVYGIYVVYTRDIYGEEARQFRAEGCSTYDRVGYDYRWLADGMDEPHVHRYVGAPEPGSEPPLLPGL